MEDTPPTEEASGIEGKRDGWLSNYLADNSESVLTGVLGVAIAVSVITIGFYIFWFRHWPIAEKTEVWAQFGDYLGGVLNPIFGFLSVFALLVALVLQTRELRLSREALKVSQDELKATREEQAKSAEALASQNKAIQKQSFEQTFFAWLGTYRQLLSEAETGNGASGRAALKHLWEYFLSAARVSKGNPGAIYLWKALLQLNIVSLRLAEKQHFPIISKAADVAWSNLYKGAESELDSLFRILYRLLKWIDEQPDSMLSSEDKWLYVGIVRSQLSWIEMVFLFYNGMTDRGAKFKVLINRYAIFDNLTVES